jgi:protein involved in polysaccharide export with SLBB domain
VAAGLWIALAATPALGQEFGRVEETETNVAYFYYARPGQATVQVSVWGTVPRPGIYEIPDTTDLDKLLTMAGGLPIEARRRGDRRAEITVRLFRPQESGRELLLETDADSMLRGSTAYPSLEENDIVVVETIRPKDRFGFRDVLSLASTLGTLTLLGLRIFSRR